MRWRDDEVSLTLWERTWTKVFSFLFQNLLKTFTRRSCVLRHSVCTKQFVCVFSFSRMGFYRPKTKPLDVAIFFASRQTFWNILTLVTFPKRPRIATGPTTHPCQWISDQVNRGVRESNRCTYSIFLGLFQRN